RTVPPRGGRRLANTCTHLRDPGPIVVNASLDSYGGSAGRLRPLPAGHVPDPRDDGPPGSPRRSVALARLLLQSVRRMLPWLPLLLCPATPADRPIRVGRLPSS